MLDIKRELKMWLLMLFLEHRCSYSFHFFFSFLFRKQVCSLGWACYVPGLSFIGPLFCPVFSLVCPHLQVGCCQSSFEVPKGGQSETRFFLRERRGLCFKKGPGIQFGEAGEWCVGICCCAGDLRQMCLVLKFSHVSILVRLAAFCLISLRLL